MNIHKTANIIKEAVDVHIIYHFKRPKSHYRTGKYSKELKPDTPICHITKPDVDNLIKFTLDVLSGVLYKDDNQVVSVTAIKLYDDEPKTWFDVTVNKKRGF